MLQPYAQYSLVAKRNNTGALMSAYYIGGPPTFWHYVKCYAKQILSEERIDDALIIVAMNSDKYAGTCYMYWPTSCLGDYGRGATISYFPKGGSHENFAQTLHHEALGHGFAKLADEYSYEELGYVPSPYKSEIQSQQSSWGWWKNVDFTSDPTHMSFPSFCTINSPVS